MIKIPARNTFSVAAGLLLALPVQAGEFTGNTAFGNNYIWRGLTQTENAAVVSGGLDYTADNGFYAGTWAANVSYAPRDVFSYEHDVYFGYSGGGARIGYDVGYLYYNYDRAAEFDFGEIYGALSIGDFSLGLNILANTEANESPTQDFGFGEAFYLSASYATEVSDGLKLGFHVGYHDGDFNEAFNGVPDSYVDYNVSLSKDGFTFMISGTDLDDPGPDNLDNDELKFVVSYALDFDLLSD